MRFRYLAQALRERGTQQSSLFGRCIPAREKARSGEQLAGVGRPLGGVDDVLGAELHEQRGGDAFVAGEAVPRPESLGIPSQDCSCRLAAGVAQALQRIPYDGVPGQQPSSGTLAFQGSQQAIRGTVASSD